MLTLSRLVVGRFSPKNGCLARDGEVLAFVPRVKLPKRLDIQHKFRSASEVSRTSKFGWIAEAETSFTLIEFVSRYFPDRHDDPALLNHLEIMFRAAAKQPLGTPLACGYRTIGVEKRVIEPVVHRVFFHA